MYPRTIYIENKIKWFQKLNPIIFHREIRRAVYDIYAKIINNFGTSKLNGGIKLQDDSIKTEFIQTYDKYKFKMTLEKTKYDILLNILTFEKDNPKHCALINIERNLHIAYLSNISYFRNCTTPDLVRTKGGSTILQFLLGFLKKNKDVLGINRIVLKDNSIKVCNNCPHNIQLNTMYFLLHHQTWYGKYGFRPFDKIEMKPDIQYTKLYNQNREKISQLKVKDTKLGNYFKEAIKEYDKNKNIDLDHMLNIVNLWKDKPLSQVLRVMMKDYDKYCCIFGYIQKMLYIDLNLQNFYGFDFYLDI